MSENSKIEWCDHTRNFWSGCTEVSPACAFCYARVLAKLNRIFGQWGKGAPRSWHGDGAAKELAKWNKEAADNWHVCVCGWSGPAGWESNRCGKCFHDFGATPPRRPRVFLNSMSDWLDDEIPIEWLAAMLDAIRLAPNLDFLLLTKRPENFRLRMEEVSQRLGELCGHDDEPSDSYKWQGEWIDGKPPANVWIGTTAENQEWADKRIPHLLRIPAKIRFLSCEPLLGPLDMETSIADARGGWRLSDGIHWVITGGESGKYARPSHPDWFRSLRDQCAAADVPFFFKQWGEWCLADESHGPTGHVMPESGVMPCGKRALWIGWDGRTACPSANGLLDPVIAVARLGKDHTGRLLDGIEHSAFPSVAAVSSRPA